jgi:hypothetical protein
MPDGTAHSPEDTTTATEEDREARDDQIKVALENDSDQLLAAVDEIRTLESRKRQVQMSSPEFHRAAEDIERKARAVFGIARAQREVGDALSEPQGESIDDRAADEDTERDGQR